MARPHKKLDDFRVFMRLYYDLHETTDTYSQTYERTEQFYEKLYGKRLFTGFGAFHSYKSRYLKLIKI